MEKRKLLLTSTGLSSKNISQKFKDMVTNPGSHAVAIVTTAAEDKEKNKYSQLAQKQFEEMGFTKIDFIDLENEPNEDFSSYGVIYVCGGNTFKLLKFARDANFKNSVGNFLKRGGIYVGVSAGSIIVGPSISIANEVEPDPNDIGLEDFTGFGITDLIVLPHYSPEMEIDTLNFEKKHRVVVERISNSQAVLINDGQKSLIE